MTVGKMIAQICEYAGDAENGDTLLMEKEVDTIEVDRGFIYINFENDESIRI